MRTDRRKALITALCLASLYTIWGSTYLAQRIAIESIPPLQMAALRFLVSGAALLAGLRAAGAPSPSRAEWRAASISALPLFVTGMGSAAIALQHVPSGLAALVFGSVPLWTALFERLSGGRSRALELAGLSVGFAGVLLVSLRGALRADPASAALLLSAAASYALGCVFTRRLPLAKGTIGTASQMVMGGAFLMIASLARGERLAMPPTRGLLAMGYLIVLGSLVAYTAFGWLLRNTRAALATSYAYVNPLVALALGAALAGERVTRADLGGLALVLVAVALVTLGGQSRAPSLLRAARLWLACRSAARARPVSLS